MMAVCGNCGQRKPEDQYRACADCRAQWRQNSRKPGGYLDQIDELKRQRDDLRSAAETLLDCPSVAPYRLVSPYRELQIAADKARDRA